MDFLGFMNGIFPFALNHIFIIIVLGLGSLFFMYQKPKLFFSILCFGLFLAGLFYMLSSLAHSGLEQKKGLIYHEEERYDDNR